MGHPWSGTAEIWNSGNQEIRKEKKEEKGHSWWFAVGVPPDLFKDFGPVQMEALYRGLFPSNFIEPWLYLRVGDKEAPWPFRGVYLQTGPSAFALGPAHRLAWCTIPMTALAAGLFWGLLVFQLLRARARNERRAESVAPELA